MFNKIVLVALSHVINAKYNFHFKGNKENLFWIKFERLWPRNIYLSCLELEFPKWKWFPEISLVIEPRKDTNQGIYQIL